MLQWQKLRGAALFHGQLCLYVSGGKGNLLRGLGCGGCVTHSVCLVTRQSPTWSSPFARPKDED